MVSSYLKWYQWLILPYYKYLIVATLKLVKWKHHELLNIKSIIRPITLIILEIIVILDQISDLNDNIAISLV